MKKLENVFKILIPPMKVCKLCFKPFHSYGIYNFINNDEYLCQNCNKTLKPEFINFEIDGIKALSIYHYDETIQKLLYQFKGCFDYELFPIFLNHYKTELSILYKGYTMVPAPSFSEANEKRGFNHVVEMFKILSLDQKEIFIKLTKEKQANSSRKQRESISSNMKVKENVDISNLKILLIDDVYTTGNTMKTMIRLIKELHPKDIKVLVMSKTHDTPLYHITQSVEKYI